MLSEQVTCTDLKREEARVVRTFGSRIPGFTPLNVCLALNGWVVSVHERTDIDRLKCRPGGWYYQELHQCVGGYTFAEDKIIEVNDVQVSRNALAHELVHVVDLAVNAHVGHCRWDSRGVKAALRELTGTDDPTPPDEGCLP
jgi:hypothetical protein